MIGQEVLAALMLFAAQVTGLPVPDSPPSVVVAAPHEIQEKALDAGYPAGSAYVALYFPIPREVWVPPGSADDPVHLSVVLHELVHDMQYQAGGVSARYQCDGTPASQPLEREAYDAQFAYLRHRGLAETRAEMYDLLGLSPLFMLLATECPPAHEMGQ